VQAALLHFETFSASQKAAVVEHVAAGRVQCPVAALARPVRSTRQFNETVVERKIVPKRVLPALCVLTIVRKPIHDELINLAQSHHLQPSHKGHMQYTYIEC